jgi:hypothetical protein
MRRPVAHSLESVRARNPAALLFLLLATSCSGSAAKVSPAPTATPTTATSVASPRSGPSTSGAAGPATTVVGGTLVRLVEGIVNEDVVLRVRDSCPDNDVECVGALLKQLKQKPEVATTYADLGGAFLVGLYRTYGNFGVGVSVDPWKANSNSSIVVVGGIPTVQFVADRAGTIFGFLGAGYDPLKAIYPNLGSDAGRVSYVGHDLGDDGHHRLSFLAPLYDGCRACGTGAAVQFSITYDKVGRELSNEVGSPCATESGEDNYPLQACPSAALEPTVRAPS